MELTGKSDTRVALAGLAPWHLDGADAGCLKCLKVIIGSAPLIRNVRLEKLRRDIV
jgi:hypothetical protein